MPKSDEKNTADNQPRSQAETTDRATGAPRVVRDQAKEPGLGDAATAQSDPIPVRQEGSGFRLNTTPTIKSEETVNHDKSRPTWMDPDRLPPTQATNVYLPNQTVIPGDHPQVAVRPYGSEPNNLDPATGNVIPSPNKVDEPSPGDEKAE